MIINVVKVFSFCFPPSPPPNPAPTPPHSHVQKGCEREQVMPPSRGNVHVPRCFPAEVFAPSAFRYDTFCCSALNGQSIINVKKQAIVVDDSEADMYVTLSVALFALAAVPWAKLCCFATLRTIFQAQHENSQRIGEKGQHVVAAGRLQVSGRL